MSKVKDMEEVVLESLERLISGNAVTARPISVGNRHVLTLCELSLGWGGASAEGEGGDAENRGRGIGGGGGGAAKAEPVAMIIIDNGEVRLEAFDG